MSPGQVLALLAVHQEERAPAHGSTSSASHVRGTPEDLAALAALGPVD